MESIIQIDSKLSKTKAEPLADVVLDHNNGSLEKASSFQAFVWTETKLFLELAVVTSLMYMGLAACPLLTASCVGRLFGPVYLSAFSLANLMGNLCTQTLVTGLFGAIDTLSPQAMGKGDYSQVGFLAVRGVVVSIIILIPINAVLILKLESILVAFGEDPQAAHYANQWYNVFVASIPFSILYQSLCKFLTVQRILRPIVIVSVLSTALIWPTLQVCATQLGFLGTAVAYVLLFAFQSLILLAWVCLQQPHDVRTWQLPNNNDEHSTTTETILGFWRFAILDTRALKEFVVLGLGGVMAQCEWVFWEALGLVVGKLGIVAMTAHTIPTQIVFNVATLPIACGIALAVRMGISLPKSVPTAKGIALLVTLGSFIVFAVASMALYAGKDVLIYFFVDPTANYNNDGINAKAHDLAESIWPTVSLFNLNCAMFGIMAGISSGLGKQWVLGTINAFWLWVFGMPIIYYTTSREGGGLEDAWFWMNVAYVGINASLICVFVTTDWYQLQRDIVSDKASERIHEEVEDLLFTVSVESSVAVPANEQTSLIPAFATQR